MLRSSQTTLAKLLSRPALLSSILPSFTRSFSSTADLASCCSPTRSNPETPFAHSHQRAAAATSSTGNREGQSRISSITLNSFASQLPRHPAVGITNASCSTRTASPQLYASPCDQRLFQTSSKLHAAAKSSDDKGFLWKMSQSQGHQINPCNSSLHPAVKEAGLKVAPNATEICVQEAYTPESKCWGCGPLNLEGLHLKSYRSGEGLTSRITLPSVMCAFPGIINGGILSTLVDCHGNWTAAICLMDQACLPMPPLTLTSSILVNFKDTTPPETELVIRSRVVEIKQSSSPTGRTSVEVDVHIYEAAQTEGGPEKLLVHASGLFKRLGAARAL